jgi:[ribosomal protein S18]-alanine N-acetyltransferase
VRFVIRDFVPEDFETLWWIDQQCFSPGIAYSHRELRTYIRRRGAITLVALTSEKKEIAAFLVAQTGLTGHIITIDVLKSARRAGVGSLLLSSAEERLAAAGSRAVGLETAVDNMGALAFYKGHGYHVIRSWPHYYANGLDALVLEKLFPKEPPSTTPAK